MFANDDFLMLSDVELALRRNLIETTSAGVALNGNDTKAVSCIQHSLR